MSKIAELLHHLDKANPFPSLSLLESALICSQVSGNTPMPKELTDDLKSMFEDEIISFEATRLTGLGFFQSIEGGYFLNPNTVEPVSEILNEYKVSMQIEINNSMQTSESFFTHLISYLAEQVTGITSIESFDRSNYEIVWQKKRYRLQIALTPAWLPAVVDDLIKNEAYLALFGPFAAQNWEIMQKYYVYPEFRNRTAYFDPWFRQKMNVSKGGLFTYFDWYFRDTYGLKFIIPRDFITTLQNFGLLRYNDEK